jgi:hypothetical protein
VKFTSIELPVTDPKLSVDCVIGSAAKANPVRATFAVVTPVLTWAIDPVYEPPVTAFRRTDAVTGWPVIVPPATGRLRGDEFVHHDPPASVDSSYPAGGVTVTFAESPFPEIVYD